MCRAVVAALERYHVNISTPILAQLHFDPLDFFHGLVDASGMVVDFRGRITRSFIARFEGERQADAIRIRESLNYSDGVREYRLWHIAPFGEARWSARADGLVGSAIIARDAQNAAQSRWTYQMDIPVSGRTFRFGLQDIMTLVAPDRMVAQTPMKKFGLTLATISSEYRKIG
jgi:hypothetical protein